MSWQPERDKLQSTESAAVWHRTQDEIKQQKMYELAFSRAFKCTSHFAIYRK